MANKVAPAFKYQEYLASREWAVLRTKIHERAAGHCERCGYPKIAAVHHLTYERIGREELVDLQAVCTPCHAFLSGKIEFDPSHLSMDPKTVTAVLDQWPTEYAAWWFLNDWYIQSRALRELKAAISALVK